MCDVLLEMALTWQGDTSRRLARLPARQSAGAQGLLEAIDSMHASWLVFWLSLGTVSPKTE